MDKTGRPEWADKNYSFTQNRKCEYFPCHKTEDQENFNCLFCYCPLYALGKKCGGNFNYYGDIKDCTGCLVPHIRDNYGYITERYTDIIELLKKIDEPS